MVIGAWQSAPFTLSRTGLIGTPSRCAALANISERKRRKPRPGTIRRGGWRGWGVGRVGRGRERRCGGSLARRRANRGRAAARGSLRCLRGGRANPVGEAGFAGAARRTMAASDSGRNAGKEGQPALVVDGQIIRPRGWSSIERSVAGLAWSRGASRSGMGRTPEPIGRACQRSPRGVKASTASLTCVASTSGASGWTAVIGSSSRITRLPVSSVTPAMSGPTRLIISSSSSVVWSAWVSSAIFRPARRSGEPGRGTSSSRPAAPPGDVRAEPVVTVADIGAGIPAAQRGDRLDVRRQVAGVLGGRDGPLLLPRPRGPGWARAGPLRDRALGPWPAWRNAARWPGRGRVERTGRGTGRRQARASGRIPASPTPSGRGARWCNGRTRSRGHRPCSGRSEAGPAHEPARLAA